jgi:[ribosomal protein S5]-alanine N-acetyltransferase
MIILETERLNLRKLSKSDAGFILELLNEPSFLQNIGDKGVRNTDDAIQYILTGPIDSYERFGFGQWLVELKDSGEPIGMCGLMKKDALPDADIGFAFLPRFWSKGYAVEAATAVIAYGSRDLGLRRIVAVVNPDNEGSIRVLEKIGLKFERMVKLSEERSEIKLFTPAV